MRQETFYITKNSPFVQDITVKDGDQPRDLTGYVAEMFIAKYFGSETRYSVPVVVHGAPTNGVLRISINDEGTGLLPSGIMHYTIYLQPPEDDRYVLLQGQVIIIPSI
jgi:hypothetical protein